MASFFYPVKKSCDSRMSGYPMIAFTDRFLKRYTRRWKLRTLESDRHFIRNHILPAFGKMPVDRPASMV